MNDQNPSGQNGGDPDAGPSRPQGIQPRNTPDASPPTTNELDKIERDLNQFERSTLRWARTAVVMSGLAALFVCGQWLEMRDSTNASIVAANATAQQARTSARQLELTERPWISIEAKPVGGVEQEPLGAHLIVAFTYRNIGITPATAIVLVPKLNAEGITDDAVSERKSVCQSATMVPADFGETLFPNTSRTEVRSIRRIEGENQ